MNHLSTVIKTTHTSNCIMVSPAQRFKNDARIGKVIQEGKLLLIIIARPYKSWEILRDFTRFGNIQKLTVSDANSIIPNHDCIILEYYCESNAKIASETTLNLINNEIKKEIFKDPNIPSMPSRPASIININTANKQENPNDNARCVANLPINKSPHSEKIEIINKLQFLDVRKEYDGNTPYVLLTIPKRLNKILLNNFLTKFGNYYAKIEKKSNVDTVMKIRFKNPKRVSYAISQILPFIENSINNPDFNNGRISLLLPNEMNEQELVLKLIKFGPIDTIVYQNNTEFDNSFYAFITFCYPKTTLKVIESLKNYNPTSIALQKRQNKKEMCADCNHSIYSNTNITHKRFCQYNIENALNFHLALNTKEPIMTNTELGNKIFSSIPTPFQPYTQTKENDSFALKIPVTNMDIDNDLETINCINN